MVGSLEVLKLFVLEVLHGARRDSFRQTVFGCLLDVPHLQGMDCCSIKCFFIRYGRIRFIPRWHKTSVGCENGLWPGRVLFDNQSKKQVSSKKKRYLLRERLFPNHRNSSVKICDLKSFILNRHFLEATDDDAVKICLIYVMCERLLEKEINNWSIVKLLNTPFPDLRRHLGCYYYICVYEMLPVVRAGGFALRKNRDTSRMKRWSDTKILKWVDVNKIFEMKKEGRRPRNNMSPSDDEMTSSYYMSCQEYVYGERNSVPSPVRDHYRREDESSSSMSSIGRSHGRGGSSGKPSLEEVLKRLHAPEQQVFLEEVDNENIWNNISFEEPAVFQTNFGETVVEHEAMNKNKTNENVFGDIENNKKSDERIDKGGHSTNNFDDDAFAFDDNEHGVRGRCNNTVTVNHFDDHVFYSNEVTPDKPKVQNPSKYRCPPYTELHTTPNQKRRLKKKVDAKSTITPFVVVHDFSVLRLQYVAGGEVVLQNYLFHAYKVEHRFYNLDLDREFWSALFGHTHNGWLDEAITILLMVSIRGSLCLVLLHTLTSWFLGGIWIFFVFLSCYVLMPIHSFTNHWLFGELRLDSMEVVTPQNHEQRKRSGAEDVMYSITTMKSSKQTTTSSIALII
uniref:Uncharacterized protein n=1 Tax=Lactuca sativa TaxID=4236 RepID=A0A9R1XMU7_LACSA|nr:hypothetical protein LSAT_V11C300132980 [Lactuca sativa]